jgi:transposase
MPDPEQMSRKHRWQVQGRMAVLEYASAHGLKPAAERFGLDRKTVRQWRDRAKAAGEVGLVPRYPKRRPRRIPDATVPSSRKRGASSAGAPAVPASGSFGSTR